MNKTPHFQPDLTECDREPIHIPGAIQPHGCLLALDRDAVIVAASQNCNARFGIPGRLLGVSIDKVVDPGLERIIRNLCARAEPCPISTHRATLHAGIDVRVCLHTNVQGVHIAEFLFPEPAPRIEGNGTDREDDAGADPDAGSGPNPGAASGMESELAISVHAMNSELLAMKTESLGIEAIGQAIAQRVHETLAFDRVSTYRFLPDGSGEVFAEAKRDDKETWVGLRYPATDVPVQARAMFIRNPIRLIRDIKAASVPLDQDTNALSSPLDQSDGILRAVSPVHIEYLQNMGVAASMSIPIVVGGELWGLIACHHDTTRDIPIELWPMLRLLSQIASTSISNLEQQARYQGRIRAIQVSHYLVHQLNASSSISRALLEGSPNIRDMIGCDGVAIVHRGECFTAGRNPENQMEMIRAALLMAELETTGDAIVAVAATTGLGPGWDATLPGVLALRISDDPDDYIAWFRSELIEQISWAGKPTKPVRLDEEGRPRLSPRTSFAKWTETVRGASEQWTPEEIERANGLCESLRDVVLRLSALSEEVDARARTEKELRALTSELEAIAYAASHDLRRPVQNLTLRLTMLAEQLGEQLEDMDPGARRSLERATHSSFQMHRLIDGMNALSSSSTAEFHYEPVELEPLLTETLEELSEQIDATGAVVRWSPDLPEVRADRTMLKSLLVNLVENAICFRHPDRTPEVTIDARVLSGQDFGQHAIEIQVTDNGQGIGDEDRPRLFKAFSRGSGAASSEGTTGLGLGLAICRRIANRHGGGIEMESVLGEGTTFTVQLNPSVRPVRQF